MALPRACTRRLASLCRPLARPTCRCRAPAVYRWSTTTPSNVKSSRRGWRWPSWIARRGSSPTALALGLPGAALRLDAHDPVRAHVIARVALEAWRNSGMSLDGWRELQPVVHEEFAHVVEEAYHEANRWLIEHRVMPEVDLRPLIRRSRGVNTGGMFSGAFGANPGDGSTTSVRGGLGGGPGGGGATRGVGDETRLMTRTGPLRRENSGEILSRLNRLVGKQLPGFGDTAQMKPVSPVLAEAINNAQVNVQQRLVTRTERADAPPISTPQMLAELQQRKQALKQAATTPVERATIEIVAMMFQSILTEDRIPAAIRVWFARLQMPVLRVAVSEPDFFATIDHPARRLIDRMGACVWASTLGNAELRRGLSKEVKRGAGGRGYPDTGRRVFQTVLVEFGSSSSISSRTRTGHAQRRVAGPQIEQRETLAIQYTTNCARCSTGAGRRSAPVPVPGVGRRAGHHRGALRRAGRSDQGDEARGHRCHLVSRRQSHARRARRGAASPAAIAQDAARWHGLGGHERREARRAHPDAEQFAGGRVHGQGGHHLQRAHRRPDRAAGVARRLLPDADNVQIDESMVLDLSGHEAPRSGGRRRRLDAHTGHGGLGARAAGGQLVHARLPRPQRAGATIWRGLRNGCRCSSRRRGAACCFINNGWRRFCGRACCCRRRTNRSPCAPRVPRWPSSTPTRLVC